MTFTTTFSEKDSETMVDPGKLILGIGFVIAGIGFMFIKPDPRPVRVINVTDVSEDED